MNYQKNNLLNVNKIMSIIGYYEMKSEKCDNFRWFCYCKLGIIRGCKICLFDAFIWSCMYGDLWIAKLLYSCGDIDIHENNDEAFRLSCKFGHLYIAKWLYYIGDIYYHNINIASELS